MWKPILSAPKGQAVMTKIDDSKGARNEQVLVKQDNLWFAGDMYVYYQPTHWRELTQIEKLRIKNENERKAIDDLERANAALGLC
jgi:hypothetical protein